MVTKPSRHRKHNVQTTPKGTIHIKSTNKGKLHSSLGVPKAQKIPAAMLAPKPTDSPLLAKRKNFAKNARKFNH